MYSKVAYIIVFPGFFGSCSVTALSFIENYLIHMYTHSCFLIFYLFLFASVFSYLSLPSSLKRNY